MTYHPEAAKFLAAFFVALGLLLLFALPGLGIAPLGWLEKWMLVGSLRVLKQGDIPGEPAATGKRRRKGRKGRKSFKVENRIWGATAVVVASYAILDAYVPGPYQLNTALLWPVSLSLLGAATLIIYGPSILGPVHRRWTFWLSVFTSSYVIFESAALLPTNKTFFFLSVVVWFSSFCFTFGLLSRIDRNDRERKALESSEAGGTPAT